MNTCIYICTKTYLIVCIHTWASLKMFFLRSIILSVPQALHSPEYDTDGGGGDVGRVTLPVSIHSVIYNTHTRTVIYDLPAVVINTH